MSASIDSTSVPKPGEQAATPAGTAVGAMPGAMPVAASGVGTKRFMLLAVMLLTVFLAVANVFIVNVATPSIQLGLQAGFTDVQFVMTSYTLAYAIMLILGGRLGDRYGRKRLLMAGVAGFAAASFLCGIAGSVPFLVGVRILQGASAAMMMPQVLSLIQANYPPERRAGIFALYGAAQGIAATSGQLIGGLLLRWDPAGLDWRTVFFFSVPVSLLILALAVRIDESKGESSPRMDWTGTLWAAAGLFMLVYPLIQGQKEQWPASLIACLLLSVPVLAAFVRYERRMTLAGREPLMNVGLFAQRRFAFGMLVAVVLFGSQSAYFLVSAYFLQFGLGFTALKAGLVILPMGAGYFLASIYSAKAVAKFGSRVLTVGALFTSAGYALLALSVHASGTSTAGYEWIPALAVLGAAQGALAAPLTNAILSRVERRDAGTASGILTTGMQVAFAVGIALIGIVLLHATESNAAHAAGKLVPRLEAGLAETYGDPARADAAARQFPACFAAYAGAGGPSAVPADCLPDDADESSRALLLSLLRQANAANYAYAFEYSLYALAAFSLLLVPLVAGLVREKRQAAPGQSR